MKNEENSCKVFICVTVVVGSLRLGGSLILASGPSGLSWIPRRLLIHSLNFLASVGSYVF